ncbi:MAG TPA: hypothetical protein VH643_25505 [Gemmataceae bacterium]|jgi:hypothetical protein
MTQKRTPPEDDLSDAIAKLHQAAQSLATSTTQMTQAMQQMVGQTGEQPPASATQPPGPSTSVPDKEARRFYEMLEQTGQLVDVDDGTDLAALPAHVTHIRRPDGSIHRISFCASPLPRK